ncbi:MAG: glycosyltransferase [Hyphomicrobiales bacterium]|nr:glycosyltransferase [Hyphomicrobiales bacterium]
MIFYTHALAGGGAERVWALLASGFAARGHDVLFVVDHDATENRDFLHPAVKYRVLASGHGHAVLELARLLRQHKPDVTLSALCVANLKLAMAGLMASALSHCVLSYHGYSVNEPQRLSQISYRLTPLLTRLCARTICVSDGLLNYLRKVWRADVARTLRIYNPAALTASWAPAILPQPYAGAPLFIACGRLNGAKNFTGLVRAFAAGAPSGARLRILGEGSERAAILAEARRLKVADRVDLPGYAADVGAEFARADGFVLNSDQESFGLVVVEALACGLPVIATDCDGPCEILDFGRFGTIVPRGDEAAMARALANFQPSPAEADRRRARARDFGLEPALGAYEKLIREVMAAAGVG